MSDLNVKISQRLLDELLTDSKLNDEDIEFLSKKVNKNVKNRIGEKLSS
jgi:hypothetical protein